MTALIHTQPFIQVRAVIKPLRLVATELYLWHQALRALVEFAK